MGNRYEISKVTTIEKDWWGHEAVPGIRMDLPDTFKEGAKVKVTIIVEDTNSGGI
ncbi:MAG: hypothetical protein FJY85_07725 [Deltaproteobacteria bacterium]|nr:hypothetical protein [Deltaproteobacteria bacterium]